MSEVLIPRVLWAQRKDVVYITFEVFEVKSEKIEIDGNKVNFSGIRGSDDAKFAVSLELYGNIDADNSKISVGHREISLILAKSEPGPFWPRLLKSSQKMHYIHTDFSKWVDEDEEDEEIETSGMGNFGNFDFSQFGGAGGSLNMDNFEESGNFDEDQHECEDENCSHTESNQDVKISGLTKNNESFEP